MKVIFIADVQNVARAGQTKDVANGYARNFLLPRKLAVLADSPAAAMVQVHLKKIIRQREILEAEMAELAKKITGVEVTLKAKVGENEKLYGSITGADIAEELGKAVGRDIDKRTIVLAEPIRQTGYYDVAIRFTHEITAVVKVVVMSDEPDAKRPEKVEKKVEQTEEEKAVEAEAKKAEKETKKADKEAKKAEAAEKSSEKKEKSKKAKKEATAGEEKPETVEKAEKAKVEAAVAPETAEKKEKPKKAKKEAKAAEEKPELAGVKETKPKAKAQEEKPEKAEGEEKKTKAKAEKKTKKSVAKAEDIKE